MAPKEVTTTTMIRLKPGDKIIDIGEFPRSLYQGIVKHQIVVDKGVEIHFEEGGSFTRPEDHQVKIIEGSA